MCISPKWLVPFYDSSKERYSYRYVGSLPVDAPEDPVIDEVTGEVFFPFQVGCGKCLECLNLHKLQWLHRLLDEQSCHQDSCFLTLTYAKTDGNLVPKDYQLFLKRLRRKIAPVKVRFFLCGEYGSRGHRPHYHVALFGYNFPDKIPFRKDRAGFMMYRSAELEKLWSHGFSSILPANSVTFGYISKDMQKLLDLEPGKVRPFLRMSLRPGIGSNGWNRSLTDGKVWHRGKSCVLPRYYRKLAKDESLDLSAVYRIDSRYAENRSLIQDVELKRKKNTEKLKKLLTNR
uniref:Replication initiator protein n=1 Tax=Dulem virus 80 TaxID=3145791 RepID=A0AAU8AX50_9VIRU